VLTAFCVPVYETIMLAPSRDVVVSGTAVVLAETPWTRG
jgi:hypothetical protein